jgi:ABC-type transport system involved in multi-copper enzyme maturation permease subunit
MITAIKAELIKFRRPRLAVGVLGAMVLLGILATVLIFATAKDASQVFNSGRPAAVRFDLAGLATAKGPTRGFTVGAGFGGVVILILFTASVAGEFGGGTLRTLLLVEPHRFRVLAGKVLGLALFAAVGFLFAEIAATITAIVLAQIRGISIAHWFSSEGLRTWISVYGNATLSGLAWGLAGAAIGTIFRSVPLALAVAAAWFFPFENILHETWATADRWFPGLLFQGLGAGTGGAVTWTRALLMITLYLAALTAIAATTLLRRDIA